MSNNLRQAKKDLKAFAKRAKDVKYTESLLFSYLITGMITFSIGLNTSSNVLYERLNKELVMSADKTRTAIKKKKKANEEAIEDLNLELIQLMEQGDQVVKSPWQSWQFGANTFISSNNGTYKGRGDKAEKYSFNSIYNRENWADTGILSNRRKSYMTSSLSTSTIGKQSYGLASLLHVQEPEVEIQIMANVRPKSVSKEEIAINPKIDMPREVVRPNINLKVTEPITAPTILIPTLKAININVPDTPNPGEVSKVEAPSISITLAAPTIGVSITPPTPKLTIDSPTPSVNTLTIEAPEVSEVSAITVNKPVAPSITPPNPSVNAVSFEVPSLTSFGNSPTGDNSLFGVLPTTQSRDYRLVFSGEHKITDGIPKKQNSIIEYMGNGQEYKIAEGSILTVDVSRSRAVALDTGFKKYLGGKDGTSYDSGIKFSVENKGTIDLTSPVTGGMEIQPDVWDYAQATAINSGIIKGNSDNQAALLITKETTYRDNFEGTTRPSKGNRLILINKKNIELGGKNSAGFATGNFQDDMEMDKFGILRPKWSRNIEAVAINEKDAIITLTGEKSHGMVVSQTDNELEEHSKFENKGLIKVKGSESGGITLLAKLSDGAINSGTIEITGNNSFGLYSQYYEYNDTKTSGTPRVKVGGNISPVINSQSGKINIEGTATKSIGIRVGSESGKETGLKNLGTITINSIGGENIGIYSGTSVINNDGTIEVRGKKNIGMMLKETKSDTNSPSGNKKKITVDGTNGFGVMLIDNDNSAEFNNYTNAEIVATGVNSVGLYTKNSIATNKNGATISSTQYHAVVQNGGTFTNSGIVSTESGGKAGLYSENGTFTIKNDGEVKSSNGGIAVFTSGSIGTIEGKVTVGASANSSTGIGVYSDGSSTRTTFQGNNAELTLGTGTVGLYSSKASDFGNVFTINKLKTSIGDGAVFAYFGNTGNTTDDTVNITNTTLQNLTVSSMGTNSAIFYGAKNTTININGNITADSTKFSNINDSAQFLVSDNGIVNINSGKTLTSELKTTISGLNGATVTNEGTLALTGKDGAVGIYSNASTATNSGTLTTNNQSSIGIYGKWFSTLTNNNVITTSGNKSVGIFAENSTVENKGANGKITAKGTQSAGIYGMGSIITNEKEIITEETGSAGIYANDSDVTNKSTGKITIQKGSSAGIYATSTSMKNVTNDGDIEVGLAGSSEIKGVGIYAGGYQNVEHNGNINIHMGNSIGIYGEGENVSIENKNKITSDASVSSVIGIMADKAKVSNLIGSEIKLQGKDSVGVYGINESEIENSGSILITSTDNDSKSVGILADKGTATNKGTIKVAGGKSAGMLGLNGATITNDATTGVITITGDASAGMYVENSLPSNAGTINIESNKSAGIFAKITDAVTRNIENTGTIKLGGTAKTESVGMYAEIGSTATGTTTLDNKNQITVEQEKSVGMFVKNGTNDRTKGKALNNATTGKIDLNVKETVGIYAYNAEGVNDNVINVTKENSAGMYGSTDSHITNNKEINVSHENSAGMYALDSNATNAATGTITLTGSATATSGSAGMYGKLTSNVTKVDYTILNQGQIQLTSVTKNVGIYGTTEVNVTKILTLKNEKEINIASGSTQSVGIYAKNDVSNDKNKLVAVNTADGTIIVDSNKSIGISAEKSTVDNSGTITMKKAESAGIYGKSGSKVTNNLKIEMKENQSAGIYLENSDAENAANGTITVDKGASAGIYGKFTSDATADNTIVNNGTITLVGTTTENKSAGIYGELASNASKKLTISNNKKIDVNMEKSVGIYALNETNDRANLTAENNASDGEINVNSKNSVGMLANNSIANNKNKIKVNNEKATGMYGENGSLVTNTSTGEIEIKAAGEKGMGIYATGKNTTTGKVTEGVNDGTININGKEGIGMLATAKGKVTNKNKINGSGSVEGIIGMYGSDDGTKVENASAGKIELAGKKSTGMFAKDDAVAENSGNIKLTSTSKNSVGMFGSSSGAGKKINLTNKNGGTIDIESESSTGMFTKNLGNLADSVIKNEGTINQKAKNTVGIYTPKSDIQKVGKINLNDAAESSVAVYLSNTAKADTSTGEIDLNSTSQNQVAYYIKGTATEPTGALYGGNIGKVKGYGVGVYLDGGVLNATTSKLDYTANGMNGNGLIGVLMKGATADISAYNQEIKVGDSALGGNSGDFYAIGIYTDGQGIPGTPATQTTPRVLGTPKTISTAITTGANGVGLFAENSSNITYTGTMNIGDNKVAGTGIYVGNGGTKASEVTIASGATINLKGSNGVGAIVTTGATVDFQSGAKIEFGGDGVGIFAQKGGHIIDNGGTLVTNKHSVERTRVTEGSSETAHDLTVAIGNALDTGNILSHVINGEAIIQTGVTVEAKPSTENIIGLMADGNSNPGLPWVGTSGYDAENRGKLDLSNAETSTAMYLDSSRGLNSKDILVGNKSTGIYGIYKNTTAGYIGAPAGFKNEGIITTTTGSKITVGDESSAIYSIGFNKVENKGEITGKDKSVGIYAKNTPVSSKKIDVLNTGNITLGKGSAGIYIAPETSNNPNATVTNSGNITIGDSTLDASGNVTSTSVGIYAMKKTNVTTTGDVTVGNRGFALYGNDSTLTVNGGNYNFANSGSLAYLENNAVLNYNNTGTLTTSSEPMLYIINSKAHMNNNDIVVSAGGTGVYMNGTSAFSGWNNMTLNNGSTGIYVDKSSAVIDGNKITGVSNKAKGIVAIDSNVTNKANMEFSSDDSIGIFSQNKSGAAKTIVNSGNIDITGKRSIAAYLEGTSDQTFENSGIINVDRTATSVKNDSTVGIYAQNGSTINVKNSGTINVGESSFGIYSLSENGKVETAGSSVINVADKAIGIYKKGGIANVGGVINVANHTATDANSEPVGVYGSNGITITDTTSSFNVGDKSYGVILANPGLSKTNVYSNSSSSNVNLGNESTFIYTEGSSKVTNNATITSGTNGKIIAIYGKDGADIVNNGIIDLSHGTGNQGILVTGASNAVNRGVIKIGKTDKSDPNNIIYGIGMAAVGGANISNERDIYVTENLGIGMYGDDRGTTLRNSGNIYLDSSNASASNKVQTMMGVFVNNGAKFVNTGNITTTGSYHGNDNVQGLVGVAVLNGSTLENYGKIDIDADSSYGVLIKGTSSNKSIIKNYGEINISGLKSYGVRYDADSQGVSGDLPIGTDATPGNVLPALSSGNGRIASANGAQDYYAPKDPSKTLGGVGIVQLPNGRLAIQRNGVILNDSQVQTINYSAPNVNYAFSNFGVYVDTLGRTRPINVNGATSLGINSDLLIGTEFSVLTNSKNVIIGKQILQPFLNQINAGIFNFTPYSASLTWMATPEVDPATQQITRVLMTKIPYTAFVLPTSNEFNFTDGLEQRYDVNSLDSREKTLFNKLNTIGNSEETLLVQAIDEMMGHQYANVQQRIFETGNLLNKEFGYLRNEWETKSKDSNKIKVFGMKGNYKTDTAGIIDYTNKAYGFAYLNENETIKLGESSGWYAGAVKNKFDFSDIGGSKEEQTMVKAGVYKSKPLGRDHNNGLNWTVAAEGFVGTGDMDRKFLVVDDIFEAKSQFHTYGLGLRNELRKNIRTSERTSISPYGSLRMEYGRFGGIKEDNGQMRLEVKSNDYYSIKPEVGVEFKYRQPMAVRTTFIAKLGLAYENELGKVGDVNNKARVRYTTADWFNIRGEKDDRRGNGKVDLNLGIENTRFGVTVNAGYDTKGENVRGGIGFRAIY
ncbi:autotransporter-associated N-terminal domain-containing protein [Leptotrichia sp. oral taxon 417]|uniref:autotransporter-associated N-terminal domain-containing protein n=1 Tax=Leptotrichia sp. oral taxon 417 TaxID=712365 RepID=UPI0015B88FF8|nr:autotransporter-associated N-terminal domain-containing protein [Leptotrichia sp. oral taxon 417]NWO27693.1 autotransporter-associated N-terminal domain-containing protein [Leptotrichia sp. oral taxon 417]